MDILILLIGLTSTQIITTTLDMKTIMVLATNGTQDIIIRCPTIITKDIITTSTRITSPVSMLNSQCFENQSRV